MTTTATTTATATTTRTTDRATSPADPTSAGDAAAGPAQQQHLGSCHCGTVRFQADLDARLAGSRCNCSICTKVSWTAAIVKPSAFKLASGEESLGCYEWGGKISRRFFCKRCGVQCFARGHLAELGGDYVSVNLNALDDIDVAEVPLVYWDGRHNNWYAGARPTPWPIFTAVAAEPA